MAMEGAWTTSNANNKTSLSGWGGAGGDYWDNAVTLVDGFSLQGCESSIATTRLLAESENDFGHFRLETCVPFLTSPPPEAPRSRLPVRAAPPPAQVRPPIPPKPAPPSSFISPKQSIPVKPSNPAKPTIAPKPSHLAGKLKPLGGGFSTTIKVEGERSAVPRSQGSDSNVRRKPHFETNADSRTSTLIDNNVSFESVTKKGDNGTGFCESAVVSANHCIGRDGESESSGAFEPPEDCGVKKSSGAFGDSGGTFGEGAGGGDSANGDPLKADTGRSNSAVGDRDMNCRALIEKFNTINQSSKSSVSCSTSEKPASEEAAELKSKSNNKCNGSSVSEASSVSGVWTLVSSTHQPRQPHQPQTTDDEIEMSIKNNKKKKKGCLGIIDTDDGSFDLLTSSSNLMQPEVVESEWRHISSLATQYEFGEESLTSLSSNSRIPVRTRKESVFDAAERRESEVWRKDSGVSLTSGSSSPARRLSYPDRSVTPSGSRSYIDRTPVGSRSSTPSLLAMRSSTPSLTTMRSSTPCLLPRPITPSCGRSSTPSLPSCRSTTPSLPSLLPRPTTPSTVGGRPTTPSLGSLLPRPTTPSRSLSARRGSLSLPLRSSDTPLHSRSSRPSLPCFSTISSRSGRPSPSPILSSSSMMGVVGEPSLARRWDSTPSLEVRRLSEAEQAVTPLRQKSRQFVSRNIELSARNRQLQETLKELTVQYNREKEEQEKSAKVDKVRKQSSEEDPRRVRSREHVDEERSTSRSLRSKTRERRRSYAGHQRTAREVPEEDAKHYQEVYSHLQREFTELQRSHQLLQTRLQQASSPTSSCDSQREEKNLAALRNKLTAAETKASDLEKLLKAETPDAQAEVGRQLVEEKQALVQANLELKERMDSALEREERAKAELQDNKDQAELLEFRVLELEEGQEKKEEKDKVVVPQTSEAATETDPVEIFPDSGCVSMQHSRAPSLGREDDFLQQGANQVQFQDQKIQETQAKLHALVREVAGPTSKSLLLQTVALFEALLARIKELQTELGQLKKKEKEEEEKERVEDNRNDDLVLEVEALSRELASTKQDLERVHKNLEEEQQGKQQLELKLKEKNEDVEKKEEVHRKLSLMQSKVEEDLRRQVGVLSQKLEDTLVGCRSESEMHGESVLKASELERQIGSLQSAEAELRAENTELRERLCVLLEQQTSKSSTGSLGSDLGDGGGQKPPSSGIGSDLSDSETSDSQHSSLRSRSSSPEKRFSSESGVFDMSVETSRQEAQLTEQYLREIASLTEEVEKLTAFRDLVENRMEVRNEKEDDKEATPVNEERHSLELDQDAIAALHSKLADLTEEKCELEEAENDSRLRAQVAEAEVAKTKETLRRIEEDLAVEKKAVKHLRASWEQKEQVASEELGCLEEALARAEERGSKLEESRVGLVASLDLLVKGVTIWSYVHHHRHCLRPLAAIKHQEEAHASIGRRSATSPSIEDAPDCKRLRLGVSTEELVDKEVHDRMACGSNEDNELKTSVGCGEDCQAWRLHEELSRLQQERLLLAYSHADDQRRLQEHEVQLQLLEREVGEAQQSQTDLVGQEEIQQLREKKEEQEEQIQTLEKIFSDIESEIQGSDERLTLAQQIRQLVESEARLAREVDEHEKKEVAFRETLSEADVIMSSIEQGYHSRVSELEENRRMLEARLQVQEAAQERLQQALRGKPDAGQISQLLESLTNLEKVELGLREKISSLERSERELGVRLLAEQKTINNLKEELKEHEEVAVRAMEQEVEVSRLEAEVQRLREFEFRHGELAQSEEFRRGRVEELEGAEQTLRDNMAVVGQAAALRERRLEERLARMSEELEQQSSSVTSFEDACIVLRGEEEGLRQEIVALRGEIEEGCKREAKSAEAEEELRSELVKARATLERTNSQLAQLDSDNCTLRVRVSQGEEEVEKLRRELEAAAEALDCGRQQLRSFAEQVEQLQRRGSKADVRLSSRRSSDVVEVDLEDEDMERQELDGIARSEGGLVAVTKEVAEAAAIVTECRECSPALSSRLTEAAAQLSVLSSVICGEEPTSVRGELLRCESEEYLVRNSGSRSPLGSTRRQGPLGEDVGCWQVGRGGNQDQAEEEEQMLGSQLAELQQKLDRMEAEMTIVSEESRELADTLEEREVELLLKTRQAEEQEEERRELLVEQEKLNRLKDCWLNVLIDLLLPLTCPQQRIVLVSALKERCPPASQTFDSLSSLVQAIQQQGGGTKKLVSEVELRRLEELRVSNVKERRERSPLTRSQLDQALSPPHQFRVTRRVGSDGLLVAWSPPGQDEVTGYQIFCGSHLLQRVRSASRTKALLHGLPLQEPTTLAIHSAAGERLSPSVQVTYSPGMVLPKEKRKSTKGD